jgi:hypothetical protein
MGEACAKAELQPLSSSSNKTAALCRKGLGHDETAGDSEHRLCHFSNRHNSFSVWFLSHDALSQSGLVAELKPNCCTNIYALGGLSQAMCKLSGGHALKLPSTFNE